MIEVGTIGERVGLAFEDGVAEVTLDRPDKLNALDPAMFEALVEAGERLRRAPGLRAVVLHGAGRGFCAGLDMESFAAMATGRREARSPISARTHGLANLPSRRRSSGATPGPGHRGDPRGRASAAASRSRSAPTSAMSRPTRALDPRDQMGPRARHGAASR